MSHGEHQEAVLGRSHHIIMDGVGLLINGLVSRSDITSAIPRVSVGVDQRRHTDFSERDTFGSKSWHHGRGELEMEDPDSYFDSDKVVTWIPNQLTLRPAVVTADSDIDGVVVDVQEYAGNYYYLVNGTTAATNALYVWDNTNSELDLVTLTTFAVDTNSAIMGNMVTYASPTGTNYLYIAQGEQDNIIRADNTGAGANAGVPGNFLAVFDNFLWRADNINELYYSEDPHLGAGATWNGPIRVGNAAYPIRGMIAGFRGALWVGKDDGLYSITLNSAGDAYVATQVVDWNHAKSEYNGKAMLEFGNHLYVSAANTLMRYDGNTIQYMGPDRGAHPTERLYSVQTQFGQPLQPTDVLPSTYQSGTTGGVVQLAHDNTFLYAAVDNEDLTASYIYLWGGTGWHTVYKTDDATTRIRSVALTSRSTSTGVLQRPVLWFTEDESVKYIPLPQLSHNPLDDIGLSYEAEGELITSWFDAGLNDVYKNFFDVVIEANNLVDHVGGNTGTEKFPGTTANDAGVGTIAWADPGNAVSNNGSFAVATEGVSNWLELTNFSNSIPTGATVRGIKATVSRLQSTTAENSASSPSESETIAYGNQLWSSTGNAAASDDAYVTSTPEDGSGITDLLRLTNFGFAIPSTATILGCTAAIERKRSGGTPTTTLRGSNQTIATNTTQSITLARPAGTVAGDLMIAFIAGTHTGSGSPSAMTPPSGWSLIHTDSAPGRESVHRQWLYYKRATTSEPTSYGWQFLSGEVASNKIASGVILTYQGVTGAPTAATDSEGTGYSISIGSIATPAVMSVRLFFVSTGVPGTFSTPTSYNTRASITHANPNGSGPYNSMYVASRIATSAAGTGTVSSTFTPGGAFTANWKAQSIVLTAASGSADEVVQLVGTPEEVTIGSNKSTGALWATTEGTTTFGSSTDLWNYVLTPTIVNSSTFGIQLAAFLTASETISIDQVVLTIYYSNAEVVDSSVRLLKGGVLAGDDKASTDIWPGIEATQEYGSSTDMWGTTWTPAEVNASDFGVAISVDVTEGEARIDYVSVVVYYTFEGNSISVEFQVDNYNEWYSVGDTVQGPISTHYLPNNDELEPGIVARRIRFRLTLNRNVSSTTTTPILVSWGTRFVVRPEARYGWNMTIKAYDNMYDLARRQTNGADEKDDLKEFMYNLRDKRTPVHLQESGMPPSVTNLVTNPSFEIDTDDNGQPDGVYILGTPTLSRTAQFKTHGVLSLKVVTDSSTDEGVSWGVFHVEAGQNIAASADIYVAEGDAVTLRVYKQNLEIPAEDVVEVDSYHRFVRASVFFTADETDDYVLVIGRFDGTEATTFYVDAVEFIADSPDVLKRENKAYIDGDQLRCRWDGEPHASTSTRQYGYFVYVTGMTESERYIEDKANRISVNSEFNLQIREAL